MAKHKTCTGDHTTRNACELCPHCGDPFHRPSILSLTDLLTLGLEKMPRELKRQRPRRSTLHSSRKFGAKRTAVLPRQMGRGRDHQLVGVLRQSALQGADAQPADGGLRREVGGGSKQKHFQSGTPDKSGLGVRNQHLPNKSVQMVAHCGKQSPGSHLKLHDTIIIISQNNPIGVPPCYSCYS